MITMTRGSVSMPNDFIRRRVLACAPFRSNRPVQKSNNRPAINVTSVPVIGYASRVDPLSFSSSLSSRWRSNYAVKIADVIGSGRSTSVITGNRMIEVRGEVLAGRKEQFTCWERDVVHALERRSRERSSLITSDTGEKVKINDSLDTETAVSI